MAMSQINDKKNELRGFPLITKGLCPFESPSSDFKNGENEGSPLITKGQSNEV